MRLFLTIMVLSFASVALVAQDGRPASRPGDGQKHHKHEKKLKHQKPAKHEGRGEHLKKALGDLNLTPAQKKQLASELKPVVQERRQIRKEVQSGQLDRKSAVAEMKKTRGEVRAALKATLTPEQIAALKARHAQHAGKAGRHAGAETTGTPKK